jgi:CspA family cold shock protein
MSDTTIGLVKWFNNKVGYGFITEIEGDKREIFVHYSEIKVNESQYKYLVQGEYVEFRIVKSTNENHEWQAVGVSGMKGGPVMCETKWISRSTNNENVSPSNEEVNSKPIRRSRPPPVKNSTDDFVTVEKKSKRRESSKK